MALASQEIIYRLTKTLPQILRSFAKALCDIVSRRYPECSRESAHVAIWKICNTAHSSFSCRLSRRGNDMERQGNDLERHEHQESHRESSPVSFGHVFGPPPQVCDTNLVILIHRIRGPIDRNTETDHPIHDSFSEPRLTSLTGQYDLLVGCAL